MKIDFIQYDSSNCNARRKQEFGKGIVWLKTKMMFSLKQCHAGARIVKL